MLFTVTTVCNTVETGDMYYLPNSNIQHYVLKRTIQKQNQYKIIQDSIHKVQTIQKQNHLLTKQLCTIQNNMSGIQPPTAIKIQVKTCTHQLKIEYREHLN